MLLRVLGWLTLVFATTTAAATADVAIDLRAADPVAGMPVISADRLNFMRAYRRWRPGCKHPDIAVESGGIDPSVDEPEYTTAPLVGGCGEPFDAYAGNVAMINASMSDTQCGSAVLQGKLTASLPASFEAAGMRVDVSAAAAGVLLTINRPGHRAKAWQGARRVVTDATPTAVRAWYAVEVDGRRQVAVLVVATEPDGTVAERWLEVWATPAPAKPDAVSVARAWLLALAAGDAPALTELSSASLDRAGLEPARYAALYDPAEVETISAKKLPPAVKANQKRLAALARKGHTLVQLAVDDGGRPLVVILAVKAGKVAAVVEGR